MLKQTEVDAIAKLLATTKLSQRQIAERVGCSRSSVGMVARKTHKGTKPYRIECVAHSTGNKKRNYSSHGQQERVTLLPSQATKCNGCNALVYVWPCLKCEIQGRYSPGPLAKIKEHFKAYKERAIKAAKTLETRKRIEEAKRVNAGIENTFTKLVG